MKKKGLIFLFVFLLLLLLITVYSEYFHGYNFKLNKKYLYGISYDSSTSVSFISTGEDSRTMKGKMNCDAEFSISPFDKKNSTVLASFIFEKVNKCSFTLNGQELFKTKDILEHIFYNRKAFIEIKPNGKIENIFFNKNEDSVFVSTVKLFLGDTQFIVKNGFSWKYKEKNQHGISTVSYKKSKNLFDSLYIKSVDDYEKIHSITTPIETLSRSINGKMEIDFSDGIIQKYNGFQKILIKNKNKVELFNLSTKVNLKLKNIKFFHSGYSVADIRQLTSSNIGTIQIDEKTQRKILKKAAKEMTLTEMQATLSRYSQTGTIYEKGLFIRRSVAYLKLYPEKCNEIYNLFISEGTSSEARVLAMGILASAGHQQAQNAMRAVLKNKNIKNDIYYSVYLQNFTVVKNPDQATVQFVRNEFNKALKSKKNLTSSSLTLGAVAGKLRKNGEKKTALEIKNSLENLLKKSKTDKDKERFIDALGNTGFASNVNIAEKYIDSPNNRIRASLTNIVRFNQTKEGEELLFKLAKDKDRLVKMQAINALAGYNLEDEHLQRLNNYIKKDIFGTDEYLYLLQIYSKYEKKNDLVKEALIEMRKRPTSNAHLRATIENMLKNL